MSDRTQASDRPSSKERNQNVHALPIIALPFLVSVAPATYLWSANVATVSPSHVLPVVAILVATTAICLAALAVLTRDMRRSAIAIAVAWVPLLTFGYQLDAVAWAPKPHLHEPGLIVTDVAVTLGLMIAVWRWNVARAARFATVVVSIFIVSTLPGLLASVSLSHADERDYSIGVGDGPDIYWIILDAYGREDALDEIYDLDNRAFIEGLRQRGFYVADRSYSNYAMTHLSLASTLTMDYLPLTAPFDVPAVGRLIQDAPAIRALRDHGYRYVHFETEWFLTAEAPLADIVYRRGGFSSEFERAFFKTTLPGRLLPPPPRHAAVTDTLAELREVPSIEGPTFTFVHLLVPHPPFMFDENGTVIPYVDEISAAFEKEPYAAQLSYVNSEMTALVDDLLANSDREPVIIIQGDHGPALTVGTEAGADVVRWERMGILDAMLVPDDVRDGLYPSISPVNTFRVLLREHFGEELPTLADRSFYNWYNGGNPAAVVDDELQLIEVTDSLP